MTLLTHRGEGPQFPYAGQPTHILAGHEDTPSGFAAMELTIPPHFSGPMRPRLPDVCGFDLRTSVWL